MSDIVERLRAPRPRPGYDEPLPPHAWAMEAATEIERLSAELAEAKRKAITREETIEELFDERDALRAALESVSSIANGNPLTLRHVLLNKAIDIADEALNRYAEAVDAAPTKP